MTRHQRRKAAKAANVERTKEIAKASLAYDRALIVKRNLQRPVERNYFATIRSCLDGIEGASHRAYVCQNAKGSVDKRR